jgi:hypothetical protein
MSIILRKISMECIEIIDIPDDIKKVKEFPKFRKLLWKVYLQLPKVLDYMNNILTLEDDDEVAQKKKNLKILFKKAAATAFEEVKQSQESPVEAVQEKEPTKEPSIDNSIPLEKVKSELQPVLVDDKKSSAVDTDGNEPTKEHSIDSSTPLERVKSDLHPMLVDDKQYFHVDNGTSLADLEKSENVRSIKENRSISGHSKAVIHESESSSPVKDESPVPVKDEFPKPVRDESPPAEVEYQMPLEVESPLPVKVDSPLPETQMKESPKNIVSGAIENVTNVRRVSKSLSEVIPEDSKLQKTKHVASRHSEMIPTLEKHSQNYQPDYKESDQDKAVQDFLLYKSVLKQHTKTPGLSKFPGERKYETDAEEIIQLLKDGTRYRVKELNRKASKQFKKKKKKRREENLASIFEENKHVLSAKTDIRFFKSANYSRKKSLLKRNKELATTIKDTHTENLWRESLFYKSREGPLRRTKLPYKKFRQVEVSHDWLINWSKRVNKSMNKKELAQNTYGYRVNMLQGTLKSDYENMKFSRK